MLHKLTGFKECRTIHIERKCPYHKGDRNIEEESI